MIKSQREISELTKEHSLAFMSEEFADRKDFACEKLSSRTLYKKLAYRSAPRSALIRYVSLDISNPSLECQIDIFNNYSTNARWI